MSKTPKKAPAKKSAGAQRQHKYFNNKIAQGWTRLAVWIAPGIDVEKVRAYATKKWGQL